MIINIPPRMVKLCADELAITLIELVKCKRFPNDMNNAEISPLFKKKGMI